MTQTSSLISILCPEHQSQHIGALDIDSNAQKLGYCLECITRDFGGITLPKSIRAFPDYLKETSSFYAKCRQQVQDAGEPPGEYQDELSKKAERLENLSKHVEEEQQRVKNQFSKIRKNVLQLINLKEKECLNLLEKEISGLSEIYEQYENLLKTGWAKFSDDIEAIYPTADALQQRISRITNMDQLQAFVRGIAEDIQIENQWVGENEGLEKRKQKINHQINVFRRFESSFPELQGKLLNSEDLESFTKELLKEFSHQEITVKNPLSSRMKESPCESQIIDGEQYETLKSWLPNSKDFNLKLLYRSSKDGKSASMFHRKCDGKGASVTLVKCRFKGAESSSVIGGFIDQSLNSNDEWTASEQAFLFSITSGALPVKCPILESARMYAFYGNSGYGPWFGSGEDLFINSTFENGRIHPQTYSNASALFFNNKKHFTVEEFEVFQVQ